MGGGKAAGMLLTEYHHHCPSAVIDDNGHIKLASGHAPNSMSEILKRMFLPEGWPESCSEGDLHAPDVIYEVH
jgi:hypothetical protein